MDENKKESEVNQKDDKSQVKKSLFIYLMVFLGSVIILIGLAYIFQLKDNRETENLLHNQMVTIENNQTLIQNKQLENEKLKEDVATLETQLASSEENYKILEASSEILEKQKLNNEKLLKVYELYVRNKRKDAREALLEVSTEFVSKEVYDTINKKLNW